MSCRIEMLVAGYVLGVLDPADRDLVRGHLPHCPGCRAALAESAPLPALLSRVAAADAAGTPVPDEAMFGRLLAAAEGRRRARRRSLLAAAAAVAVLAVGGGVAVLALDSGGDGGCA